MTLAEITPSVAYCLFCCEIYQNPESQPNNGATEEGEKKQFSCFYVLVLLLDAFTLKSGKFRRTTALEQVIV